jgi:hypothetical protein
VALSIVIAENANHTSKQQHCVLFDKFDVFFFGRAVI